LHTLRHTFASIAGELGFTELTIRAMLGHASQNVTQDYIHIDEALKLAVRRTSDEIARLLDEGAAGLRRPAPAA
jgi:integrase